MAIIEWDGSLAIGHQQIDEQHQVLLGLINKVHSSRVEGGDLRVIRRVLMELYNYSVYHFKEEEALMAALKPERRSGHIREHEKFIETLDRLAEKTSAEDTYVGTEVFQWLIAWLLDHISVTDKQLAACLPDRQTA